MTDFNLFELQQKHPLESETYKLSRHEEALEGADWEWWLTSPGLRFGLRIQAKLLKTDSLRYEKLNYKISSGNRQIDVLIQKAVNGRYGPTFPLYVLYNFWDKTKYYPKWLCQTSRKDIRLLGCGIVEARALKTILDQHGNKLENISDFMYPWSCLVCCRGYSMNPNGSPLPIRAFDFLSQVYGKRRFSGRSRKIRGE